MVGGNGDRKGPVWEEREGRLCEQKQQALPAEDLFVTKSLPISKARGRVLSNVLTGPDYCHDISRRGKSRDFWVPMGETSLPSTWLGAGRGMGIADEWEAVCLLGPQTGEAAGSRGHQLLLQSFHKGIKFSDVLLVHSQLLW